LISDSSRLYSILTYRGFKFKSELEFNLLQEDLPTYKDAYFRSSLFYLLNRCSTTGQVSCGKFDIKNYTAIGLNHLKTFKKPELFDVLLYEQNRTIDVKGDYILFPTLNFTYNLSNIGKNTSYDGYNFNHRKLKDLLKNQDKKIILIYNKHPGLFSFYKNHNIIMIDKHGKQTLTKDDYEEAIVTNF